MNGEMALPGLETEADNTGDLPLFGEGVTEYQTRVAIAEIEAEHPVAGARRTIKQLCLSLARSIDRGNLKGRAIANEAAQLFAMMQQLAPPDVAPTDHSQFSPELKRLFDAFASGPTFEPAPRIDDPATGDGA